MPQSAGYPSLRFATHDSIGESTNPAFAMVYCNPFCLASQLDCLDRQTFSVLAVTIHNKFKFADVDYSMNL